MKTRPHPSNGIIRFIPGLALFKSVNPALLRTELVVAVTVFAVLVPSAMAYGDLTGVTPVAGLYVALGAMVMYALFGSSRQLITGPEATTAIMTAAAIAPLAGGDPVRYAALAALAAILVGVLSILAGIVKLGFITDFLSKPILVGYIFGTSLIVIGSQLGKMFGIKLESDQFFRQIVELISRLDEAHLLTIAIGIVCMAALLSMRRVNRALPGPLIVVVAVIVLSAVFALQTRGVAVVGAVPARLPRLTIPAVNVQDIFTLLPAALALTILIYADENPHRAHLCNETRSEDRRQPGIHCPRHGQYQRGLTDRISSRNERLSHGRCRSDGRQNAVGGTDRRRAHHRLPALLHTAAGAAAHRRAGRHHHSRLVRLARCGGISLLAAGASRRVLAGTVVTAFGVLTVGILQGILVAVMLSLINVIHHISRPHDALLDYIDASGGTVYRGVADKETALTEPGLIVYRFDAPLVFANAAFFTERLEELVTNAGTGLKCVIFDAEAISDFDSTAAEALENLDANLERLGVELWIARANKSLCDLLLVTGLTKRLGKDNIYPSVRAAVTAYQAHFGATWRLQ